jgi:activator of HSP90 ATPase
MTTSRYLELPATRRQVLASGAVLGASVVIGSPTMAFAADPVAADSPIHQQVDLKAAPDRVYEALLDDKQFAAFSGAPAQIQREAGGAFTLAGGRVVGRNIELVPNRRIVQAWRQVMWPEGVYSIVRFELSALDPGTRIVFDQNGFPPQYRQAQIDGWPKFYWTPLRKYLES